MTLEVKHADFRKVAFLFDSFPYDLSWLPRTLHEPHTRIFADKMSSPSLALVCPRTGVGALSGNLRPQAVRKFVEQVLFAPERPAIDFLSLPSDEWVETLLESFGCAFHPIKRVSLSFENLALHTAEEWESHVPPGFEVVPIDEKLAERIASEIDASFSRMWPDPLEFAQKSIGFCVMHDNMIASVAYSAFPPGPYVEFTVATARGFRGRGLVVLAAAPLLEYCLENHLEPHWSADASNRSSLQAARKLGFATEVFHTWVHFTPWNATRRPIVTIPEQLEPYTGEYVSEHHHFILSSAEGKLWLQLGGKRSPKMELAAEGHEEFFALDADYQLTFRRDAQHQVSSFFWHQENHHVLAKRVYDMDEAEG